MVVATYTINDARKQKVSFAGPYYVARPAVEQTITHRVATPINWRNAD